MSDQQVLSEYVDVWWQAINDFTELLEELDAGLAEGRPEVSLPGLDHAAQLMLQYPADGRQLIGRGHPVGRGVEHAPRELLPQARYPDHEKFVEVIEINGEELRPFQQRVLGPLRLFQHAAVECKPAQLPVEIKSRGGKIDRRLTGR